LNYDIFLEQRQQVTSSGNKMEDFIMETVIETGTFVGVLIIFTFEGLD